MDKMEGTLIKEVWIASTTEKPKVMRLIACDCPCHPKEELFWWHEGMAHICDRCFED